MRTDARPLLLLDACARCGHSYEAHTHLRAGSDCGLCHCRAYRNPSSWWRWLPWH
jgi:hypothetical protein